MIAVIADDLTGAAEIAGLGLTYGFKVEIVTSVTASKADMLIIATNTRSVNRQEAYNVSVHLAKELKKLNYDWLYKKTDSVLRGNVLTELVAMLNYGINDSCLLVPANPRLKRIIRDGIYYIDGKPLTETDFIKDPGYAVKSAKVMELLGRADGTTAQYLHANENLLSPGIYLGEAYTSKHVAFWARQVKENVLPAGAAHFFEAIMKSKKIRKRVRPIDKFESHVNAKVLIVCGSAFRKDRIAIESAIKHGAKQCAMPDAVFYKNKDIEIAIKKWTEQIIELFANTQSVIVEINKPVDCSGGIARHLSAAMAKTVTGVLHNKNIGELYIEGGDTAFAILKDAGYKKFIPFEQITHGTIRMHALENPDICITLKVGSYKWPKNIFKFHKN